ncbi:MAG TPA: nickel pincer cofactor biosynthesis protein LarC [Gemmatimonadales bacterium]|jgi:pyridinium-3,5-bisthiocarboxylic acid mononucleotide nickel chelatase|nr:nickel pincer cofactor biosynthesis protein LarC [Gemmatimonadales bacterium]
MPDGRFAILDPVAGISGDMLLGALVAAGAPEEWLRALPGRLGFPDVRVEIGSVVRCGLEATKVDVVLPGGKQEHPAEPVPGDGHAADEHVHPQEHGHRHEHTRDPGRAGGGAPHHHVGELIARVERAPLSGWVRERAVDAFRLLGEAEGRIHGVSAEEVALHEVGAVDALVDIVGGIEGFERLGITRIYNWPVTLGTGWVRAAHGVIPVPAPATAMLLEGVEIGPNGPVSGEATTPTGAVLLRVLSAGRPPSHWRAVGGGAWGAGGRNPEHYPNALRLLQAEAVAEAAEVILLSTDLDDLSPEYLDPLREALFAAGALDVQLWASQMKKGRTGFRVEATVAPAEAERVGEAFFRHSTTAGIRRQSAERVTLPRREVQVEIGDGTRVRVKVLMGPDGPRVKPEYEDVAAVARRTGRPAHQVARDLQERALRLVGPEGAARLLTPNKES